MREKVFKPTLIFLLLFALVLPQGCNHKKNNRPATKSLKKENEDRKKNGIKNGVIVYYFHGDYRCASCYEIEQRTEEAVKKFFGEEMQQGTLVYKVVNCDEEKNSHFVDDYKLYTKSVVLSLVKNRKEVKYKNLTKVWEYLDDEQQFYEYIKAEVTSFLNEFEGTKQ